MIAEHYYLKGCSQVSNALGVFLSDEEETLFFFVEFLFSAQKQSFLFGQIVLREQLFAFRRGFTDLQGKDMSMEFALTAREREREESERQRDRSVELTDFRFLIGLRLQIE